MTRIETQTYHCRAMSKLSKLYSMIANAQELGIELGTEVYKQTDKLEEEIIKKEELTKEKLEQKLNKIIEENKAYQEKFDLINSQLQDASNHPLFDNIEQAKNNFNFFNNECLNLEKILSNLS